MPRRRTRRTPEPLAQGRGTALGAALCLALVASGCDDGRTTIEGVQPLVQERRPLRPVDTVRVSAGDGLNVRVIARPLPEDPLEEVEGGRDAVVWIEGPADLLGYVVTEVEDATLRVSLAEGVRLRPVPDVEVHVRGLRRLAASGAGVVRLEVEAGHVPDALGIEATGAVLVEAAGAVRALDVRATGSGDVHLLALEAAEAVYQRQGSGDGWIRARDHVRVELSGSGDLYLGGEPDRVVETSGSGRVLGLRRD